MDNFQEIYRLFESIIVPFVRKAVKEELKNHFIIPDDANFKDELLTARESADFIGDALQTFYGRTSRGEINTYGPPGRIFCKKSELIAFKEKKRTKSKDIIEQEVYGIQANKKRAK